MASVLQFRPVNKLERVVDDSTKKLISATYSMAMSSHKFDDDAEVRVKMKMIEAVLGKIISDFDIKEND